VVMVKKVSWQLCTFAHKRLLLCVESPCYQGSVTVGAYSESAALSASQPKAAPAPAAAATPAASAAAAAPVVRLPAAATCILAAGLDASCAWRSCRVLHCLGL
jgi:hypothetical protein